MAAGPSRFIWYELLARDPDIAGAFYGLVLGWTVEKAAQANGGGGAYWQWKAGEDYIGGLMALPEGAEAMGMAPQWLGYVSVPDVEAAVASVTAAGGGVNMAPTDVPGVGRFALLRDPQGAAFYVMTPVGEGESGAFAPDVVGHCGWNELTALDQAAAFDFYAGQFGWTTRQVMDMGPLGFYRLWDFAAPQGAGAGGMTNGPPGATAHWLFYFNVEDIDAAMARVGAGGGSVTIGPHQVPTGNWIVIGRDPEGGEFALVGPRPAAS